MYIWHFLICFPIQNAPFWFRQRLLGHTADIVGCYSRQGTAGTHRDSREYRRRRPPPSYEDEDGPTAAELAYEQSLEDYKRQTGKTPKNADTSRHRSERTPNRRPRPQDRSGGRRPPPRERSRSKSRQDILDAEARSAKDWERAKTPESPKTAASAFFQQDRPGSSMSQAGSPPQRRVERRAARCTWQRRRGRS